MNKSIYLTLGFTGLSTFLFYETGLNIIELIPVVTCGLIVFLMAFIPDLQVENKDEHQSKDKTII